MLVHNVNRRVDILGIIVLLIILALISRMCFLQIVKGSYYSHLADGNRIRIIPIMAPRGNFYDRNEQPLVTTRPGFTASILPLSGPVPEEIITKLAAILSMSPDDIKKKIAAQSGAFEPIRIKTDIGPDLFTKIEERRSELPGVVVEAQPVRSYTYNELAAHIFGYVGEINDEELSNRKAKGYKSGDILGKYGLEKVYDQELRGKDGGDQVEVDVSGRPVQVLGRKDPIPGLNLVLTIDSKLQKAAEDAIDEQLKYLQTRMGYGDAKAAAAVAINPKTGEILAMVSKPSFNPNWFVGGISTKNWNMLNSNPFHPMDNKAISGEYPPGSTFKIVTGIAALEAGKVTPEEKILDTGMHWKVHKTNASGEALGWINFKEALAKSDNVYFYEMGLRLGIDELEKYARSFGLGAYTGIDLKGEEADGLVANRAYKQKAFKEEWYESETADAAIGQGFQLATPLQIATVMAQAANGGHRYKPYLVSRMTDAKGETVRSFSPVEVGKIQISEANLKLVREALREVALEGGTAGELFRGFPIQIAGKTGTAENKGRDHGWFVCYGPYDNPNIVVAVIVEHGGFGATSAGPIAKKILEAAFNVNGSQAAKQH